MVKPNQFGIVHNYPSQRKSYSTSRSGVGGRKKNKSVLMKPSAPTYFDKLKRSQDSQESQQLHENLQVEYRKLTDDYYVAIFNRWLGADDTKSKKRKVASRLVETSN